MDTKIVSTVARAPGRSITLIPVFIIKIFETGLSSPWDIVHQKLEDKGEFLIVAMAGCHQLWMYCITDVSWWKGIISDYCIEQVREGFKKKSDNYHFGF